VAGTSRDRGRRVARVADDAAEVFEDVGQVSRRIAYDSVVNVFAYLGEVFLLLVEAARGMGRRLHAPDVVRQFLTLGVQSIPIAVATVALSGAVLALYTVQSLTTYGAGGLVGGIVALTVVRETGPLISSIMMTARAGSAIAAEIGTMKATEQVDALRVMGLSPIEYLASPRILACVVMLPVATLFSDIAGIAGGMGVAIWQGQSRQEFVSSFRTLLDINGSDIFEGLAKSVVFGLIVGAVGCREGLASTGGAAGVGRSTIRAVVLSLALIFVADLFVTLVSRDGLL
jgi:phospholipid/cholesterol/gamma-HCH transport system permease protein